MSSYAEMVLGGDWVEVGRLGDTRDELRANLLDTYREIFPDMSGENWLKLVAQIEAHLGGILAGATAAAPMLHLRVSDFLGD